MLARIRKTAVASAGVIAQVVALGVLPQQWQLWGVAVVAMATALGVYVVPNERGVIGKPGA